MIYADNAATTRLDTDALECMKCYLNEEYGNPSQPYSFSRTTKKALSDAREIIAQCIGAEKDEIFFTSGGSESDNWALKGFMKRQEKKGLLVSEIEHHAILRSADTLSREGYSVEKVAVTGDGVVIPRDVESKLNDEVGLVSVMLANNEIGSVQPVKELSEIAHRKGITFHTDAVQAVGHIEIDVKSLDVDMLSASAHKFNGPRGIGFLYVRKGVSLLPLIDGGAQERGMRAGTENTAAIVGMSIALKKNCERIKVERARLLQLEADLINGLKQNELVFVRNESPNHLPGNISLSFLNSDGEMLFHRLDLMKICVSTGSACDSKNTQISHVIKAIGVPENYAKGTIRISLGRDNTSEDVREIVEAITKVMKRP
ncbi:MAG: cysteine desulfurase [Lachnospiraceae bacterium]|nr:cysteine desulfurase [Lachnospiraceae bacterium]